MENRKPHNKFIEDVKEASSLPSQTKEALGPVSPEDDAIYNNLTKEEQDAVDEIERLAKHDAVYTEGVKDE